MISASSCQKRRKMHPLEPGKRKSTHEKNNNYSDHSLSESRVVERFEFLVVESRGRSSSRSGFDSGSDGDDEDGGENR